MVRCLSLAALAPFALVACSSSPTVTATNASAAEVAAKLKDAQMDGQFVAPGHWDATMQVTEMNVPNMPPQFAGEMKKHMGQVRTFSSCLTPEEAKKPKEDFFAGGDKSCRFEHFSMGNGVIDAAMKCAGEGPPRTMTIKGTYSPDAYTMNIAQKGEGTGPMGGMSMAMTMSAKRTGACTGKEEG